MKKLLNKFAGWLYKKTGEEIPNKTVEFWIQTEKLSEMIFNMDGKEINRILLGETNSYRYITVVTKELDVESTYHKLKKPIPLDK